MGVVAPCVGVSESTAPPTSGVTFDLSGTLGTCGVYFRLPATPLVYGLINVGGRMYVPYPTL